MLGGALVHFVLIVGTVSRERRDGIGDLVEQRARPRGIIDLFPGQLNRDDFAALGIDAEMQLTPACPRFCPSYCRKLRPKLTRKTATSAMPASAPTARRSMPSLTSYGFSGDSWLTRSTWPDREKKSGLSFGLLELSLS